uniref:Uncharacterized protein n=1 Tax=Spironucleus salmonicida TaxID=348837 RepID=V6LDU0_9EUKA|eukprot:EST42438.1 Hypothetical protein SS50377_17999 [Spironucleus salmonicida]
MPSWCISTQSRILRRPVCIRYSSQKTSSLRRLLCQPKTRRAFGQNIKVSAFTPTQIIQCNTYHNPPTCILRVIPRRQIRSQTARKVVRKS